MLKATVCVVIGLLKLWQKTLATTIKRPETTLEIKLKPCIWASHLELLSQRKHAEIISCTKLPLFIDIHWHYLCPLKLLKVVRDTFWSCLANTLLSNIASVNRTCFKVVLKLQRSIFCPQKIKFLLAYSLSISS